MKRRKGSADWIMPLAALGGIPVLIWQVFPQARQTIYSTGFIAACLLVVVVVGMIGFIIYRRAHRSQRIVSTEATSGHAINNPQKVPKEQFSPPILGTMAVVASIVGFSAQLLVGWLEEGCITLHPVGHLTLLLVPMWPIAVVIALVALIFDHGHREWALLSLGLAVTCIALLLFYHYP
jgi:hypothetical protein